MQLPRGEVVLVDRRRRDHRRVEDLQRRGVGLRVVADADGADRLVERDVPRRPETVGGQRISRNEADCRLALRAQRYDEERGERVDAGDELVLGGEPEGLPGADGRRPDHGPRQLEVDPVAVVHDEELVAERLDVVLDLRLPRGHEDRGAGRVRRVERGGTPLDVRGPDADDDPAVVARRARHRRGTISSVSSGRGRRARRERRPRAASTWNGRQASS